MTEPVRAPGSDVALYVHWPYCARICPYCDFNVVRDRGQADAQAALIDAILMDLEWQAHLVGARQLTSIFFGGGTPSLMRPTDVARIVDRARSLFTASDPIEITLEANPTDAEAERFAGLAVAGVNRLSIGVQALDDVALAFLGRGHSAAEARRAVTVARSVFKRLSVDLIYARPGQTVAGWRGELEAALDLGFEHVSPYQLTVEPTTAFGRAVSRGVWAPLEEDLAADLYDVTQAVLSLAGFHAYEVSNHARNATARSAHNVHVWRGGDYLGLGPGAHGRLTLGGVRTATIAQRRVADYIHGVSRKTPWSEAQPLSPSEAAEERVLLGLRAIDGVTTETMAVLGLSPCGDPLLGLINEGYLIQIGNRVAATEKGRAVLDAVIRALLT